MKRSPISEMERPFREPADRDHEAPRPSVLVPLDGTEASAAAVPVARELAQLIGGMLHIVHAAEPDVDAEKLPASLGVRPEALRGAVVDRLPSTGSGEVVRFAAERDRSLVVLSAPSIGASPEGELESRTQEIVRDCRVPLVLVPPARGDSPWKLERILMPHDGTPTTAAAFAPAVDLAQAASAELVVLHSAEAGAEPPREPGSYGGPQYVDQPQHEWPAWAHEFLERLGCIGCIPAGLRVRLVLATGAPGDQIIKYADEHDVDLIVVAWRGQWEPQRARTVRSVVKSTPCPIVLLRTSQ